MNGVYNILLNGINGVYDLPTIMTIECMTRPWGLVVSIGQSPVAVPITQKQPVRMLLKGDTSIATIWIGKGGLIVS